MHVFSAFFFAAFCISFPCVSQLFSRFLKIIVLCQSLFFLGVIPVSSTDFRVADIVGDLRSFSPELLLPLPVLEDFRCGSRGRDWSRSDRTRTRADPVGPSFRETGIPDPDRMWSRTRRGHDFRDLSIG